MGKRRGTTNLTAERPGRRPAAFPRSARLLLWLACIPFLAAAVVLLLSDRAPSAARRLLTRIEYRGRRIEARLGIDWFEVSDIPVGWETAGHMALWACAAVLGYGLLSHRFAAWQIALGALVASIGSEIGQMLFTYSRELQLNDIVANSIGIVVGVTVGAILARVAQAMSRGPSLTG